MNSVSQPDVFGFLEDLVDEAELEAIAREPREQLRAELAARGIDVRRVMAYVPRPLDRVPAAPPTAPLNVTPIAKAKPDRVVQVMRSISLAIAASFFGLFVWRQGSMGVTPERRGWSELSDSRPDARLAPPPSTMVGTADLRRAARLRAEAHKLCDQGYWGECLDRLDEAGRLDRAGNDTLDVNEMRNRIGHGMDESTQGSMPTLVKPALGPGERPLKRRAP